jgi:signal transduction histidine kinase
VNLIQNAIKYSPKGSSIELSLSLENNAPAAGQVVISVRDKGIGIPSDQLGQVFNRFFRASNASAKHYSGLGLGLYISKEIVQRHGGRLWVESVVGEGSTFHMALPATQAAGHKP